MKGIAMETNLKRLLLAGLMALAAGAASAGVTVAYSHPENYQDMPFSKVDREQVLKDLSAHFGKLGARLPPGQDLQLEVLDIDLAGRLYPNFRGQDIRIMRGAADWPHMVVRYTLAANGQVIASGKDNLSDMMYLDHINRYFDGDTLRYEKRMIDDWFNEKFLPRRAG
jgi:hypothetical protein